MKWTHLAAILASLALVLPACGGSDENDSSPAAAGTSPAAEAEQPSQSAAPEETNPPADPKNGDGGSSAADAQRAAGDASKKETAAAPQGGSSDEQSKPAARKPRTPEEHLAALSPAERRKLERDLYKQGKEFCYAYGPKLLAKEYKFPTTDPETVARRYARLYEAAAPSLALPYQQGCLAGFRRFARNPPKTPGN